MFHSLRFFAAMDILAKILLITVISERNRGALGKEDLVPELQRRVLILFGTEVNNVYSFL